MHLFLTLLFASICHFQPPEEWVGAKSDDPSDAGMIAFIGKARKEVSPSLSFTTEPTDLSLKEYIKAVKAIHESDLHVVWRDLGEFAFRAGKGRLGEICNPTPLGEMRILQGILVQNGCAYILTGAALKEEFAEHRASLVAAIRSLALLPNLFSAISDPKTREELKNRFDKLALLDSAEMREKEWQTLQKTLPKEFAQLGGYWHILALQEGFNRIFGEKSQ